MDQVQVEARRRELRQVALARREALSVQERLRLTERITVGLDTLLEALAPKILAFCWPYRSEPDLRHWAEKWVMLDNRRSLALPVVQDNMSEGLLFRTWKPNTVLNQDRYGIAYPAEGECVAPDVLLIPLNAFDQHGFRLGYGKGYFDRTLAALDSIAIGVGFETGRAETVFPLPHDRPMQWLVTEKGVFRPL